jgi:transketolase
MNIQVTAADTKAATEADMANALRFLAMDAVQKANSGHPGMPMGMADVAAVLFNRFINVDPASPDWPDRDRFVLSAGHGSMLQYAVHHLLGYADMDVDALKNFRQLGSATAGHPEYGHALGIETTTGPLGQGLATAVGMAIAEQMLAARFGRQLVDHYTYVIAGDGCLQEGISHEAIDLAGHLGLGKLVVLWDDNAISIDGATSLSTSMNQAARFTAAGWQVQSVDGHDPEAIAAAIASARASDRPSLIACKTIIGRGAPNKQGTHHVHGAPLGVDEIAAARKDMGWTHDAFVVPDEIRAAWKTAAERGRNVHLDWQARKTASDAAADFDAAMEKGLPAKLSNVLADFRAEHFDKRTKVATRKASQMALEAINRVVGNMVGGSADLTGSNLTQTSTTASIHPGDFSGRYIHYGIREHAMAAAMNGLALHGGFIPYGGTFLVFSDYARGGIRLSALMKQRVIYVLTHDSIGLGEDGPTHQPVEHLAMLRATPNLNVFRPADIIETAECWELALRDEARPSVLALSRQDLPMLRETATGENLSARGAYILHMPKGARDITLIATGSEVEIVSEAARTLEEDGIKVAVVSMPSWEKFEAQDEAYRREVLGDAPRIAVEAAARMGWDRYIGEKGLFIGMPGFGASAPAGKLYAHFGITAQQVAEQARRLIGRN